MFVQRALPAVAFVLFCAACSTSKTTAVGTGPEATITLVDGSSLHGTITASTAAEMTLLGADGVGHTIPVQQVRSVEYSSPAPASPAAAAAPVAPAPTAPAAAAPPAADHDNHYHPVRAAIQTRTFRLNVGTEFPVRTEETIDSREAVEGQTFAAEVVRDVVDASGAVVVPHGSNAQIVIRSASKGGRFKGTSDLVLDLLNVSIEGKKYNLGTADLETKGRDGVGVNKRTAAFSGGGAAIGAIIGAIAGGGKAAAIGAGAGAGAGAITQIATKGSAIQIPAETVLTFQLDQPLRLESAR